MLSERVYHLLLNYVLEKIKNIRGYAMKMDGKLGLCENEISMVLSATIKLGNKRQSKTNNNNMT